MEQSLEALTAFLGTPDSEEAKAALLYFNGDMREAMVQALDSDDGNVVKDVLQIVSAKAMRNAFDKVLALTRSVVSERSISCLMITHNMHQALELGTRTLMMDAGRIVLDVSGPERADMTVQGLLDAFAAKAGEVFDNDRVLLSTAEDREN